MERKKTVKKLWLALILSGAVNLVFLLLENTLVGNGWLVGCGLLLSAFPPYLLLRKEFSGADAGNQEREPAVSNRKKERKEKKQKTITLSLGRSVYTGGITAISLLLVLSLRLILEKLLSLAGIYSAADLFYMSGALQGFLITAALMTVITELVHRHILAPVILRLYGKDPAGYLVAGAAYLAVYPRSSGILSALVMGMLLHHLYLRAGKALTAFSAFVLYDFLFIYNTLLLNGISGGNNMSFSSVFAIFFIFTAVSLLIFYPSEKAFTKKKVRAWELFTLLCASAILLLIGIALATLK